MDKLGRTSLHWAAGQGNLECVQTLLPHVNTVAIDNNGATALHEAISRKHKKVAECLLENELFQSHIDIVDNEGRTALHWAVVGRQDDVLQKLIKKNADFQLPYKKGVTALQLASDRRYSATHRILLRHWVGKGRTDVISELLEKRLLVAYEMYWNGRTMLSCAAEEGNLAMVEILVKADNNAINARAVPHGQTPLIFAVQKDRRDVVKLLINHGADIETRTNRDEMTPLSWAAKHNLADMVRLLLDKNAEMEQVEGCQGRTPLWLAATAGNEAVVELLFSRNANIEARDLWRSTPLLLAVEHGKEAVVKMLLENGADVEARGGLSGYVQPEHDEGARPPTDPRNGFTPLLYACAKGKSGIVKVLLQHGAELEATDACKQTPLLVTARYGASDVVSLLLDKGVNVEAEDMNGTTVRWFRFTAGATADARIVVKQAAFINASRRDEMAPRRVTQGDSRMDLKGIMRPFDTILEIDEG